MRNYIERYDYDPVGNFHKMSHRAAHGNWTRDYVYDEESQIERAKTSNRLSRTTLQRSSHPHVEAYRYDVNGNIVHMPHLPTMRWDFNDALSATSRQVVNDGVSETTYYVYDSAGQRARKVTERRNGGRKSERFYLGGFEVYREFNAAGAVALERETLHVMDDTRRIALVETLTNDDGASIGLPTPAQRYQFANHLGSASLELDDKGALISYEEYSPYGNSTFQAGRSAAEVSLKRYRYTGKERDEENGFTYHGARYCAPWLGRWTSADPIGIIGDTVNLYVYGRGNPIAWVDGTGLDPDDPDAGAGPYGGTLPPGGAPPQAPQTPAPAPASPQPDVITGATPREPPSKAPSQPPPPPPPVSGPDTTLYVPKAFAFSQYEYAVNEAFNPDNPWWARGVLGVLAIAAAPLAGAEEYIARPITNIPYIVHNTGVGAGEHIGRAILWQQQGETGEAVVESLEATTSFSVGFVAAASVVEPLVREAPPVSGGKSPGNTGKSWQDFQEAARERQNIAAKKYGSNPNIVASATKAVNLPSWRQVTVDIPHVLERHTWGGRLAAGRDLFPPGMGATQIERAIYQAYRVAKRMSSQGDRILIRGVADNLTIEMWLNTATKTIETAYPVFR